MKIDLIFSSLKGNWQLDRHIYNFGEIKGSARFIEVGQGKLLYREQGMLTMILGAQLSVFREYLYCLDKGKIIVYFVEGSNPKRMFHILNFISTFDQGFPLTASVHHLCKEDLYQGEYLFTSKNQFKLTYVVKGPKKDYITESVFERLNDNN